MTNAATNLTISGNTYPARELLRANGGEYDRESKTWTISAEGWAEIERTSTATYSRSNAKLVSGLVVS